VQRNPLIANVFYVCGKIEKWGRGTLDMIKDCQAAGNPIPQYQEVGGAFSLTLPFKEPIRSLQVELANIVEHKLSKRQQQIVNLLQHGPLNRQELMEKMNTLLTDRAMQLELAKLKKMGIITSTGKSSAIIWSLL
jgi:ATP-dependent DNA helicase RecG